jgi:aldehyde:ferredoxin oxidoreductase
MLTPGRAYCEKILRVDLTDGKLWNDPLKSKWAEEFIGGKGLGIRYLLTSLSESGQELVALWL